MYTEFLEYCKKTYPEFKDVFEKESLSPNLFSFQTVTIPETAFLKIKNFVQAAYHLRNNISYQKQILGHEALNPHKSVLMSFDFHLVDGQPKLIEINTNASHFLTSKMMESFVLSKLNKESPFPNAIEKLKDSFFNEWKLFSNKILKTICIVDEEPENQRAYFEFLLFKKMFESMGLNVSIEDYKDLKWSGSSLLNLRDEEINLVYNRSTDFYFDTGNSSALKKAYETKTSCITPQPEEYKLLADKERLRDFSRLGFLENYLADDEVNLFNEVLLELIDVTSEHKDQIWSQRKKYFFKPKNSFGGKGVYKGESITHKVFDQIIQAGNYVAQEFAPPPTIPIPDQVNHMIPAKYDLRFYVYDGEIQFATARAYVGQTTNFRTLGGGFAAVLIE